MQPYTSEHHRAHSRVSHRLARASPRLLNRATAARPRSCVWFSPVQTIFSHASSQEIWKVFGKCKMANTKWMPKWQNGKCGNRKGQKGKRARARWVFGFRFSVLRAFVPSGASVVPLRTRRALERERSEAGVFFAFNSTHAVTQWRWGQIVRRYRTKYILFASSRHSTKSIGDLRAFRRLPNF